MEQEQSATKERMILEELIEDLEDKAKVLLRYQAVMNITQASQKLKKEKIELWTVRLEVDKRTITRLLERVEKKGVAALARLTRADASIIKGSKQWKGKTVQEWIEFINKDLHKGQHSKLIDEPEPNLWSGTETHQTRIRTKRREYPGR